MCATFHSFAAAAFSRSIKPAALNGHISIYQLGQPAPLPIAAFVAAVVAALSWRARALTASGALVASIVGALALCASYGLGVLLVLWFVLASLLSRFGKTIKASRLRSIVAKANARDARQVLANGGVFAIGALAVTFFSMSGARPWWIDMCNVAAAGALAAAGADTWATEIGTLYGRAPWSLRSRSRVPAGTSGAITTVGTIALVAGATSIAALSAILTVIPANARTAVAVALGGVAGAIADTLLGAWVQQRRWCARCTMETEQAVHLCGTPTQVVGGAAALDNDLVNVCCSAVGAVVSVGIVLA